MTTVDLDQTRKALSDERASILHQLVELGADESGEMTGAMDYGDAFADAGAATAERTEVRGIIDNLTARLGEVDAATAKIDDGTYGVCVDCSKEIGSARLEVRPNSIRCVSCKASVA